MRKYPNYITFAWQRSDGDYEIVGTLNGETIDEDAVWNYLVEQTLGAMRLSDTDTNAYHREDVVSVFESGENEDDWKQVKVGAAA
jgi:hypothetical protein